jgi:hypothetical protein
LRASVIFWRRKPNERRSTEGRGCNSNREGPVILVGIFDLAWPVFLVSGSLTLVAGVGALVSGRLRGRAALTRYGGWALGCCAFAVLVVALLHPDFLSF